MPDTSLRHLFSPLRIGAVELRNRIFSTGHDTQMAHDGHVSDRMVAYHAARARGGAALIVVQVSGVHETARYTAHMLMATDDSCIPHYGKLANAVHAEGARIFGQLFHPGREIMEGHDGSIQAAYAPSAIPNSRFRVMPVPLSRRLIADIVAGHAASARRLQAAGFDGCEVVASHGYLPAQFLNPSTNLRDDEYGGDLDNRLRFLREVAAAIRAATGPDFVVGVRISGDEADTERMEPTEVLEACRRLSGDGVLDYFNVVAGTSASLGGAVHIVPPMTVDPGYVAPFARAVKELVDVPVLVAGRINQPQLAERILAAGDADMCGMTRAMICDPLMPAKARDGQLDDIRACIGCNQACIGHFHKGYPISCIQHPETGREREYGTRVPAARRKRVLVAGGGPAGMKAAAILAERGHDVILCEGAEQLGGQALLAQLLPGRAEFGGIVTNLAGEMARAGVVVRRRTVVDRALVEALAPDALVIATGGKPRWPAIEGREDMHVVDAWQVLRGEANVGASVVISDWRGDWIGLGLAEKLARDGCRVRLCVAGIAAGDAIPWYVRDVMVAQTHALGVEIVTYARLFGVGENSVYFRHSVSGDPIEIAGVDTLVLSEGHERVEGLEDAVADLVGEIHVIGDALTPRTAEEAVLEGLKAGSAI